MLQDIVDINTQKYQLLHADVDMQAAILLRRRIMLRKLVLRVF